MKWVKLWLKCYISCINSLKTCLRVKSDGCKCWKRLKIDRKQFKIVRKQFKIVRKSVKRPTWYGFSSHLFNRSFANGEVHSGVRGVKGVKKLRQQPLWLHLLISKHLKTEVRMLAPHALKGQKLLAQGSALGIIAIGKAPCKGKSLINLPGTWKLLPLQVGCSKFV